MHDNDNANDNAAGADAEIDWSTIIKNRMLSLQIGYVLILEWLPDFDPQGREEPRTGEQTATWLGEKFGKEKIVYCRCASTADVEQRLKQATRDIGMRGVPVVHIEAHGGVDGFMGPDGAGSFAKLTWQELGAMLRPLNVASRFNLMLIGAACYGEGLLLAIEGGKAMPFTAVVGYTDTVNPFSLKDSMIELYRQLFSEHAELGVAVEEADLQHRYSSDAVLRLTAATVLALESFIDMARDRIGMDRRDDHALDTAAKVMRTNGYDLSVLPYSTAKAMAPSNMLTVLRAGWQIQFMTREFLENAERFAVDFDRVVEVASELLGTSSRTAHA